MVRRPILDFWRVRVLLASSTLINDPSDACQISATSWLFTTRTLVRYGGPGDPASRVEQVCGRAGLWHVIVE